MDTITASLASVGPREVQLGRTVRSLLDVDGLDHINVYLHRYDKIPTYLGDPRISVFVDRTDGRGDADKFHWAASVEGYHFTCDDDLEYPVDYVDVMVGKIEQYRRKAVVSVLGHVLRNFPLMNYFSTQNRACWGCLSSVSADHACTLVGTGVMAYHSDTIVPNMDMFPTPNIADIWFGLACRLRGIPVVSVAHEADWLRYAKDLQLEETIAGEAMYENAFHCALLNEFHRNYGLESPHGVEGL